MRREISLIGYLPPFMREYEEIKRVTDAETPEFQTLWDTGTKVRGNLFAMTADESGLKRYERPLKIYPPGGEPLEIRRARLLARMNEHPPYTLRALQNQLKMLCGDDNFSLELNSNEYSLKALLFNVGYKTYLDARAMLARMVPANMEVGMVVRHDLYAYVDIYNRKGKISSMRKTEIDWDLFMRSFAEGRVEAAAGTGSMRKIALDWDLFVKTRTETQLGVLPAVRVYKRTVVNA